MVVCEESVLVGFGVSGKLVFSGKVWCWGEVGVGGKLVVGELVSGESWC